MEDAEEAQESRRTAETVATDIAEERVVAEVLRVTDSRAEPEEVAHLDTAASSQ